MLHELVTYVARAGMDAALVLLATAFAGVVFSIVACHATTRARGLKKLLLVANALAAAAFLVLLAMGKDKPIMW